MRHMEYRPESELELKELMEVVGKICTPEEIQLIRWYFFEDKRWAEIAALRGKTYGGSYSRMTRLLNKIREYLES